MDGKYIVLTLMIGISLMCAPLTINELSVDSKPSNDMNSIDTMPVKIENSINENNNQGEEIKTELKPVKIENQIEVDSDTNEDISLTETSSMNITYQIGTIRHDTGETWSPWVSNGEVASITTNMGPATFIIKVLAPGCHVEYQVGTRLDTGEAWSSWVSNGEVASTSSYISPMTFKVKIIVQGYHVEYQVGARSDDDPWSPWVSDGEAASIRPNIVPETFKIKVILNPLEDDPDNPPPEEPKPDQNNSASSPTIEYQIGCKYVFINNMTVFKETWSGWKSDGEEAEVFNDYIGSFYAIKIKAPGYNIEYQIGCKYVYVNNLTVFKETWSEWKSNGEEAQVFNDYRSSYYWIKIRAPGYNVEYEIGCKYIYVHNLTVFNEFWSGWKSNGEEAEVLSHYHPQNISIKAMMNVPSSPTIEYQIGTVMIGPPDIEYWSDWASDGDMAVASYPGLSGSGAFQMRVISPGYHVEYQIGFNDLWSAWASDGDVAKVTYPGIPCPGFIQMRIIAPGCHVEYQIKFNQYWSQWASDGDVALLNYSGFRCPGELCMRATLSTVVQPTIDIDPDTLNLKSKGNWITCYITLNNLYNVNDINIGTIMLEDTIPAEWGDIQGDTLMVKFNRSSVQDLLSVGTYNLKVTGELVDGTGFEGYSDEIRVIDKGK